MVRAGIRWGESPLWSKDIDIKPDSGEILNEKFNDTDYSAKINGNKFQYIKQKGSSRNFVTLVRNNEFLTLRSAGKIQRFQTAGLEEKMNDVGISWEEIEAALSNEEF